jgi:hypothetical protein
LRDTPRQLAEPARTSTDTRMKTLENFGSTLNY